MRCSHYLPVNAYTDVKRPEYQERVKGFHTGAPQLFVSKPL